MRLILFDLDETLIKGDSAGLWIEFCIQRGWLEKSSHQKLKFYQTQYQNSDLNMNDFIDFFLQSVEGRKIIEVQKLVDDFVKTQIKPYSEALKIVASFHNQRCIIISATADFLVAKIAQIFDIKEYIAIKCECIDDKFSGRSLGVHSFQEGKVYRLKEYLGKEYEKWMENSCFFSDSINDLALLGEVKEAIVCNGDAKLLQIAQKRNWKCLNFRLFQNAI